MMKKWLCLFLVLLLALPAACAEDENTVDAYNWYEVFVYSYQDSDGDGIGDMNGLYTRLDYR